MSLNLSGESIPDADLLKRKIIKDLETGAEHPYKDIVNAATIIRRIAKTEGCSIQQVLETIWVSGCNQDEFKVLHGLLKDPS